MENRLYKLSGIVSLLTVLSASPAFADNTSATFQVTASVLAVCTVSATNIAFGPVTPATTGSAASTGTVTSICTKTTPYTVNLTAGTSTVFTARTMAGAIGGNTDKLTYQLYTELAATNVFGDGTGATRNVSLIGTGLAQTTTVYGKLLLNQYISPDSYTDTLTVTLLY